MPRKTQMNSITSPELISQINPENKQLLDDFEDYLKSVQRSDTTIASYESDILIAFVWCLQNNGNKFFVDWTKRNIVAYQNWLLNTNGNSPARIRRLKASLSSLSNFIESVLDDEYPNFRNIVSKVESPMNQPVRDKTVLSDEQTKMLLDTLVENEQYEKACAFALALYSGRRKSEILRFRCDDFSDSNLVCDGSLYKTGKIKTKGRGPQGKQLECFCLAKQFNPYLDLWMNQRKEKNIDSEWLFPSKTNPKEASGVPTMNSWAKTFEKILGVPFYWHSVRHATVTNFKRAGMPDSVIQQYIGWSDISMVPVYSDMEADEQLGMYFGADGIKSPSQKSLEEI